MKWKKNMVWRYTCLFAIAVVIASFVASLKQVALFLVKKGFDVCSISALLSIDVVTSRSILYRYNPLTPLTGEAKRPADMAYGYIRKEVKEDNSYTVLPGLRFIRGSTSEATQNQKETHRVEEVKANQNQRMKCRSFILYTPNNDTTERRCVERRRQNHQWTGHLIIIAGFDLPLEYLLRRWDTFHWERNKAIQ